jgi:hypothetical protein
VGGEREVSRGGPAPSPATTTVRGPSASTSALPAAAPLRGGATAIGAGRHVAVRHQGVGEAEVEVHGTRQRTAGGGESGGEGPDGGRGVGHGVGVGEVEARAHRGAEEARLQLGGLVGPGAAQVRGAVGGHDDQGAAGVVRLEDGRVQVGHRRARRGDDGAETVAVQTRAERGEGGDALVVPHVQVQAAAGAALQLVGERGTARARAEDDLVDAGIGEGLDGEPGEQCRGVHRLMLAAGRRARSVADGVHDTREGGRELRRALVGHVEVDPHDGVVAVHTDVRTTPATVQFLIEIPSVMIEPPIPLQVVGHTPRASRRSCRSRSGR